MDPALVRQAMRRLAPEVSPPPVSERESPKEMPVKHRLALLVGILVCTAGLMQSLQAQPKLTGELVYAMHVTIAPSWFDPVVRPGRDTGADYALWHSVRHPRCGGAPAARGAHGASTGRVVERKPGWHNV